jgi:glycosyltransferase involved in cell wall biosynthesis
MKAPRLSVVMPVHNGAAYLDQAVDSILKQSFADFEFVIRDDGSTDGSLEMLRRWAARDERIRLFDGEQLGPAESSSWIVRQSRAPLIARMDADDIAFPDRLQRQFDVLSTSSDMVLLGTMSETIDRDGRRLRPHDFARIARNAASAPFAHASIMFRRDAFDRVGGYRAECDHWEDLDFYLRMARAGRLAVLAEPLLAYRVHASTRLTVERNPVERSLDLRYRCLEAYRAGGNYDHLLKAVEDGPSPRRLHPSTFVALGSMQLWSRVPPDVKGVFARANLGFNRASARSVIWAVWAWLSPASLRWTLARLVQARNLLSGVRAGRVYDWDPKGGSETRHPARSSGEGAEGLASLAWREQPR